MPIDLTGKSFNIAQSFIDKGQALNLDFSVINNGDEAIAPFSFDIVLSKDSKISQDDLQLGNYAIKTGLEAGQDSGLKSYRYFTPAADSEFWKIGQESYTVGIRLDPKSNFVESNKINNSNVGSGIDLDQIEVLDFGVSDLKGSFIEVSNQQITPGEKLDLSFSIANDSPERANPFSVDVYLSPGIDIGEEGAIKLGTYDIRNGIEPNSDTGIKHYEYPTPDFSNSFWQKGDGKYYIAFDIDSQNEVTETREGNNRRLGEGLDYTGFNVTGLDSAVDLVVTNFKAPANAQAGDTVTVEYEITNQGGTEANLFAAGFYLFGDDYLADNDNLQIENVPEVFFFQGDASSSAMSLEAGATTGMMTTEITLPESWAGYSADGDHYLGVEVDPYDDVNESSELNNSLTGEAIDYQKIALQAPNSNTIDLVGTHFEIVQDQIVPGQKVDLGFTVKNEGLAIADPFSFDLYLSQDANIDPAEDFYLGTYNIKDGLKGNEDTGLKSFRYTTPNGEDAFWNEGDGTYYAGMIIDPDQDLVESNEQNNRNQGINLDYGSTSVTGIERIADLKTSSFDVVPETIDTGATFEVSYEILNDGNESADLLGAGFFIFTEDYLMNHEALSIGNAPEVYFLAGNSNDANISLEAGATTGMVTTDLTMPDNWAGFAGGSGDYYIGFAADPYGDIAESDETNNSLVGMDIDYQMVTINVL